MASLPSLTTTPASLPMIPPMYSYYPMPMWPPPSIPTFMLSPAQTPSTNLFGKNHKEPKASRTRINRNHHGRHKHNVSENSKRTHSEIDDKIIKREADKNPHSGDGSGIRQHNELAVNFKNIHSIIDDNVTERNTDKNRQGSKVLDILKHNGLDVNPKLGHSMVTADKMTERKTDRNVGDSKHNELGGNPKHIHSTIVDKTTEHKTNHHGGSENDESVINRKGTHSTVVSINSSENSNDSKSIQGVSTKLESRLAETRGSKSSTTRKSNGSKISRSA